MSQPNQALADLLREAGFSEAGLARRVNDLGRARGLVLDYDYTAVYRWTKKGQRPRDPVPILIAEALTERLGRTVTLADLGMAATVAVPADLGLGYSDHIDGAIRAAATLWRADLEDLGLVSAAPINAVAWTDATLSWLVRPEPDRLVQRTRGRRVGRSDVAALRATVDVFARLDNQFGGGHARRALIEYLRCDAAELLDGCYSEDTGREVLAAVAEATLLAAWMTYDSARAHGLAQRYFVQALRLAQAADNVLLGGSILDAMSHQATFLGRHREAANLARAARTGTSRHATATLTAHFHAMEARALAAGADAAGAEQALSKAVQVFEGRRPGDDPDWISYFDDGELSAEFSHCFRDLGRHTDAITYAQRSLDAAGASVRSDFFVTMVLADGHLGAGKVEQACAVARQALDLGEQLKSGRCVEYLRGFRQRLAPFADVAAVRELEEYAADHPLWIAAP
jgi:tetratricopeptide (TPR) repeat protein